MDKLIKKLESLSSSTKEATEILKNLFEETEFKKGAVIASKGWRPLPTLIYIREGLVSGTAEYLEKTCTLWMLESGFLIAGNDFLKTSRVEESIEFLRPTRGFALNLLRAEKIAGSQLSLYRMLFEIYEEIIEEYKLRLLMLSIKDATDRYTFLQKTFPLLFKKLTDHQIADLIRIEDKYFYRIKGAADRGKRD